MSPLDVVKQLKPLYAPSAKHPSIVEVPELAFLMIDGRGDPNSSAAYQDALGALYGVAYTLKFALKKADPERDFKVAPLEGLWWTDAERPSMAALDSDRDSWNWTMMIAVPDAVTAAEVAAAAEAAARRRPLPAAGRIRLERFAEGLAAQIMYVGPYADEAPTIAALHAFVEEQGYELRGRHHEIYLGDPRRTAPERLKTVIRHPVMPV
ncbi:MAG: GyrI-like domain-containing protein [Actinobacteria bacterium]|nr:GyrI-like domain-containing protein [Actinomycetota bacterium]